MSLIQGRNRRSGYESLSRGLLEYRYLPFNFGPSADPDSSAAEMIIGTGVVKQARGAILVLRPDLRSEVTRFDEKKR
jgi:hypothetical protein